MSIYPDFPGLKGKPVDYNYTLKAPVPIIPELAIKEFKIEKAGLKEAKIVMQVKVKNENSFPYNFKEMAYVFFLDNEQIAEGIIDGLINIPADGEAVLKYRLNLKQ